MYCILHTVVTREKGPTQVCSTGDQYSVAARRGKKKKKKKKRLYGVYSNSNRPCRTDNTREREYSMEHEAERGQNGDEGRAAPRIALVPGARGGARD